MKETLKSVFSKILLTPIEHFPFAGLPHPNTIALIERELEAIGVERFKVGRSFFPSSTLFSMLILIPPQPVNGTYKLDAGARDRIHEAQRRTRAEQAMRKPTPSRSSPPSKQDKTAASNLVQFARRGEDFPFPSSRLIAG